MNILGSLLGLVAILAGIVAAFVVITTGWIVGTAWLWVLRMQGKNPSQWWDKE